MKKTFTLISKKVVTDAGVVFDTYRLMTSNRHWYSIGVTDQSLRDKFKDLANKVVVCEVERKALKKNKKDGKVYEDPTLYISSIEEATGKELETYTQETKDYNSADLADL